MLWLGLYDVIDRFKLLWRIVRVILTGETRRSRR